MIAHQEPVSARPGRTRTIPASVIERGEKALEKSGKLVHPIIDYVRTYTIEREGSRKVVVGRLHLPKDGPMYVPRLDGKPIPESTYGKKPGYYVSQNGLLPAGGVCAYSPCEFHIGYVKFDYVTGALISYFYN
jgi:hypothetical protein